jgi:DNA-directed RNA polymerase alpha subunit
VYSLLRQYSENRIEEFSEREIEVLFMMFRGESFESVGAQLSLSKERIRQVWVKILRKMIVVRNELEYKDLQITALQKQVLELQEIAENKRFELVPQEIIDNIDLLCKPIETIPFTLRTQRGLAKTRIKTIWDLVQCNRNKIRYGSASIGIKSFQEIEQWLSEHNLKLGLALPPNIDLMQLKQKIDKA